MGIRRGDRIKVKGMYYMVIATNEDEIKAIDLSTYNSTELIFFKREDIEEIDRPTCYINVYKKEILDEEEKEYLSAVIKPFRDKYKITITKKATRPEHELRFLSIVLRNKNDDFYKLPDELCFPNFKEETMYKKMELNKEYTLEELGL